MTNWEYIKTLDEKQIANILCSSVIPEDTDEPMKFYRVDGEFLYEDEIIEWLKEQRNE